MGRKESVIIMQTGTLERKEDRTGIFRLINYFSFLFGANDLSVREKPQIIWKGWETKISKVNSFSLGKMFQGISLNENILAREIDYC